MQTSTLFIILAGLAMSVSPALGAPSRAQRAASLAVRADADAEPTVGGKPGSLGFYFQFSEGIVYTPVDKDGKELDPIPGPATCKIEPFSDTVKVHTLKLTSKQQGGVKDFSCKLVPNGDKSQPDGEIPYFKINNFNSDPGAGAEQGKYPQPYRYNRGIELTCEGFVDAMKTAPAYDASKVQAADDTNPQKSTEASQDDDEKDKDKDKDQTPSPASVESVASTDEASADPSATSTAKPTVNASADPSAKPSANAKADAKPNPATAVHLSVYPTTITVDGVVQTSMATSTVKGTAGASQNPNPSPSKDTAAGSAKAAVDPTTVATADAAETTIAVQA